MPVVQRRGEQAQRVVISEFAQSRAAQRAKQEREKADQKRSLSELEKIFSGLREKSGSGGLSR